MTRHIYSYQFEHIQCYLHFDDAVLVSISLLPLPVADTEIVTPLPEHAKLGFSAWIRGESSTPPFSFRMDGSAFYVAVWQYLLQIPFASCISYGYLAKCLGSSPRAVGQACKHNPLPLLIPCHRVVAKNSIGGYSGLTTGELFTIKPYLLAMEQQLRCIE